MLRLIAIATAAALLPQAALAQSGEAALRCQVPDDAPIYARAPIGALKVVRGTTVAVRSGSPLPQVMVDGWRPAPGPLATVLGSLGSEAGFRVVGASQTGMVSWSNPSAPLVAVVDDLTRQAGASWSFDGSVLTVSPGPTVSNVSATVATSGDRDVSLALLDTLRGLDAAQVSLDRGSLSFSAPSTTLPRIETAVSGISEVYAFDVSFIEGRPSEGRYSWSGLGATTAVGAGGQVLLGEDASSRISSFLASSGDVRRDGAQTVAAPPGWALVVPQSQCGKGSSELTIRPKRAGDGFSMQLIGGGFDATVPAIAIGQTLLVASRAPVGGWIRMVTIRPRIVATR